MPFVILRTKRCSKTVFTSPHGLFRNVVCMTMSDALLTKKISLNVLKELASQKEMPKQRRQPEPLAVAVVRNTKCNGSGFHK